MTLKKVWADANGREIDAEEYQARQRRKKEREEGITPSPEVAKSGCCGTPNPTVRSESISNGALGGCRHRQNVTIKQPQADNRTEDPAHITTSIPDDSWVAACSCGSACSCLYCPDHPNNETSIKHTQQQVKNLAEQASMGEGLMSASFMPENTTRSCMGGRPSFFFSRTPGVSQRQLEQFFSQSPDPDAIYLAYPIQQHSWTNQPVSAQCSHIHSPAGYVAPTPDTAERHIDPVNDMPALPTPWDLLPNDSTGTWNFSDGQMGNTSFSWIDLDASRGTDYNIGQARVSSMANWSNLMMSSASPNQQAPTVDLNLDSVASPANLDCLPTLDANDFGTSCCQYDPDNEYVNFDVRPAGDSSIENVQAQSQTITPMFPQDKSYGELALNRLGNVELQSLLEPQPHVPHVLHQAGISHQIATGPMSNMDGNLAPWNGYDPLMNDQAMPQFIGISGPNSPPIPNGV
ncbi:hypothetical protein A1O3_08385 [Capronia epimyces CBS 606.96]|uniref:Copper-fist domain-containing protein n=1 Tax=Capronia epimyces CBS 606.96 TaxID=1182542 RepID=W9YCN8_9EURO|nr:uncharacterized protein A1O3_08385 [Capronia epimyces CBS 606.96]EXJ80099.1 hypothetical protein A1O3_08385 [Capronia epimyces CBS 606.96]